MGSGSAVAESRLQFGQLPFPVLLTLIQAQSSQGEVRERVDGTGTVGWVPEVQVRDHRVACGPAVTPHSTRGRKSGERKRE